MQTELVSALTGEINFVVVIFLLAIGYCIKHLPILEKISNNLIPITLIVLGVIVCALIAISNGGDMVRAIMSGVVNAAISIALHQTGKNIFEMITITKNGIGVDTTANETEETTEEE